MEAKQFVNFSEETFTWNFGGVPYTFKPNQPMFMESDKVEHFTKHLVDRELNRRNVPTNNMSARRELEILCSPSDEVVTPLEALNIEEKKKVATKKTKKVEEEFEDINKE